MSPHPTASPLPAGARVWSFLHPLATHRGVDLQSFDAREGSYKTRSNWFLTNVFPTIERPMRVEIALDPTQMVSLASRVAPAPVARGTDTARGGRGGGRGRAPRRVKKSAEELDADMAVGSQPPTRH